MLETKDVIHPYSLEVRCDMQSELRPVSAG